MSEQAPAPKAQIVITLDANGNVGVSFPSDELLCRGLLDRARATMDDEFRGRGMIEAMKRNTNGIIPGDARMLPKRHIG